MKKIKNLAAIAATMLVLVACKKDAKPSVQPVDVDEDIASSTPGNKKQDQNSGGGRVFTLSNQANGNHVLDFHRSANGHLSLAGSHSNGGNGTGGGLGNQSAVVLTEDGGTLLAVNAGSNTISSLKITGNGLNLKSTVPSGGIRPVSIAQHGDLVFVLNAGGSGNISGFKLGPNDKLEPVPH